MENTRVKKIVILVAVLLALTIVGLQFGLSNFMQAFAEPNEDVKVEYSAQVNNDKTEAQIQINTTPKEQEVKITSIELPNGEVVNDTAATYKATENGKLTFTINYKLPKVSSEEPFIEKEPEYEEKQQTTTYQVTGIQPITEQEEQTPTQSNPNSTTESSPNNVPESNPGSTTESSPNNVPESNPGSTTENPNSAPENNLATSPNSTTESTPNSPPALQQPPSTNGALQQNNLGDTPTVYTPDNAFTFDDSTGTITDYNADIGGTDVIIAQSIHGIPVKAIGTNAFKNKGLTSVSLPEGLQTIGVSAFEGNKLAGELTLPASLQTIGQYAFVGSSTSVSTNQLTSVTIAGIDNNTSQLKSIGDNAFSQNNLTGNLKLPASLQTIVHGAFYDNHLTGVTIAGIDNNTSQLQSIEGSAFDKNNLAGDLTLPKSLQTIGQYAFLGSSTSVPTNQLTSVTIAGIDNNTSQLKSIGDNAFSQNNLTGNLKLPASLQTIVHGAFYNNHLTGVTIAGIDNNTSQLQSIGDSAFDKNNLAGDLTLPKSLQTIGQYAFLGSSSDVPTNQLTSVTIAGIDNNTSQLKSIGDSAFDHNNLAGNLMLPAGLQTIGKHAFSYNTLTSVTIADTPQSPSQLTSIGDSAFEGNKLAGELKLPASLQTIGGNAFMGSTSNTPTNQLTSVTIAGVDNDTSQLQTIGINAFSFNQLAGNLTLPKSLQTIGNSVFRNNQLTGVTIAGATDDTSQLQTIGQDAFSRNQLTGDLTLPKSLQTIGLRAFRDNHLTSVTIAGATDGTSQLQSLSDYAFSSSAAGFNQIVYINIPNSVTYLGSSLLTGNTISGKYYKQMGDTTNYEINLHDQIPGFHPANYKASPYPYNFKHVTDYSYDNQTGVFTFSSDDIAHAQFELEVTNIGNSTLQEGGGMETYKSTILFNNFQPYSKVTLNLQGGQFTDSSFNGVLSVLPNTAIGHEIGANDIKFPGFDFLGWYTDAACTQPFDMMTDIVTDDMTLYAKWQWNGTQNPSVLVEIPSKIKLSEYPAEQMAKGKITLSVIYNQFNPTRNIIINTQRNPLMERTNHTASFPLEVLKPDGTLYTESDSALMKLNSFGTGNPQSATFTVQTPINHSNPFGDYTGNMTYTITLE